jgi:hypothetical protein
MDKQHMKYTLKDILAIVFFWLLAISALYLVYVKIKIGHY